MILSRHYLKTVFNNFRRNKWYSGLMIFSLAAGMFCFILAALYMNYEFSRNTNHEGSERIYRVMLRLEESGRNTYLPIDFAERLPEFSTNIESISVLDRGNEEYLSTNMKSYVKEKGVFYGEPGFFEVFSFPLKFGDRFQALSQPRDVVISNHLAEILFPGINPVGKELIIHEKGSFQVAGVLAPVSRLSVMNPGLIFSRFQRDKERPRKANTWAFFTHIKLKAQQDQADLEAILYDGYQRLFENEKITGVFTENLEEAYWGGSHWDYGAQFYSITGMNKQMVKVVGYVAFGVLLCALVGFLSLALSLSIKRAKEIGVRKVNGAGRSDIQRQLLAESVSHAVIALLAVLIILELTEDYFSNLFQVPIAFELTQWEISLPLLGFTVIIGLLAGFYPALVISRLNPITVLSGFSSPLGAGFKLRKVLLIIQLTITVVLLFGVSTMQQQVDKMLEFDYGYQKQSVVSFSVGNSNIQSNYQAVLEELEQMPKVQSIGGGPFPFTLNGYRKMRFTSGDSLIEKSIARVNVSPNFFSIMGVPIISGDSFGGDHDIPLDRSCIVNEAYVQMMGGDVLGRTIEFAGEPRTIMGIAADYTDWGINHPEADPRIFVPTQTPEFHSLLLKVEDGHTAETILQMEQVWRKHEGVMEPEIQDLDAVQESGIIRLSKISELFGILTSVVLVLSLMNLFGVSVMFTGSKLKTISIRRILGANTLELFRRLSIPFVTALLISLALALPVAYWLMEGYLNDFAVRIELSFTQGLIVSISMILALFCVIGYQTLRSSRVNPVDALKEE